MVGVVIILVVLLIALPVFFSLLAAVLSAITSWSMTRNAESTHEGSELIELNK